MSTRNESFVGVIPPESIQLAEEVWGFAVKEASQEITYRGLLRKWLSTLCAILRVIDPTGVQAERAHVLGIQNLQRIVSTTKFSFEKFAYEAALVSA